MSKQILFWQHFDMGIKNAEFDADFESDGKVAKHLCEKGKWIPSLCTITFLGELFCNFFKGFKISIEFCDFFFYPQRFFWLILALVVNFEAKLQITAQQNKNVCCKCFLACHFASKFGSPFCQIVKITAV
jgi:hypothetical protein